MPFLMIAKENTKNPKQIALDKSACFRYDQTMIKLHESETESISVNESVVETIAKEVILATPGYKPSSKRLWVFASSVTVSQKDKQPDGKTVSVAITLSAPYGENLRKAGKEIIDNLRAKLKELLELEDVFVSIAIEKIVPAQTAQPQE